MTHFCFCSKLLGVAALAAAALLAANPPERPQRITSVVRPDLRTGKLVRSVIVTPRSVGEQTVAGTVVAPRVVSNAAYVPEPETSFASIDEAVEQIAARHSLSAQLIHSVIKVESNYNPYAVSSKGALGMMQLIPSTARRFGVSDIFNPIDNIQGGAKYLRYLLDLYDGKYPLALAAYNAGEAAVARFRGVPPFRETLNYLILVRQQLEQARKKSVEAGHAERAPGAQPAPPAEITLAGPAHIQEVVEPDGSVRYVSR